MMSPQELNAYFESQLREGSSADWMTNHWTSRLIVGVRALEMPNADPDIAMIEGLAAAAQDGSNVVSRPARGRSRRRSLLGLRRGLVFNLTVGLVVLMSTAALAVTATVAGIAPEPIQSIASEISGWVGVDLTRYVDGDGSDLDPENADSPGAPEDAGPPDNAGPKEDSKAPDHAGPPDNAGPKDDDFEPGPPDHAGPPDDAGPPEDSSAPDDAGPPDNAGPKDDPGQGNEQGNG